MLGGFHRLAIWDANMGSCNNHITFKLNYKEFKIMTDINTMTFDQLSPTNSKYIQKHEVDPAVIVTIRKFAMEDIDNDGGTEQKLVCYFKEFEKGLVVNRTNSQLLQLATNAKNAGDAVGKEIILYNDPSISFGGKVTGGIRIRKVDAPPVRKAPPPTNRPLANDPMADLDSDIPF
jgi:hypothetical protein